MKAITAAWDRLHSAWTDAWEQDRVVRRALDEPWPSVRAQHLRSHHRTLPFVLVVNLIFSSLTAAVFSGDTGWPFMWAWLGAHLIWTSYMAVLWWRRRRIPYVSTTPGAIARVQLGSAAVSILWSVAIWVLFNHASTEGRHFMVAIVVGNLCVASLALSSMTGALRAYLTPQVVAMALTLLRFPREYVEFELLALVVYALVLAYFGFYISRVLTLNVLAKRRLEANLRELELARENLLNNEKLASLGSLVAGVSHEVNTPLGVAVTACSSVADSLAELEQRFEARSLSQAEFEQGLRGALEGVAILQNNLARAAQLVASFKHTVVSQVDENAGDFDVMEAIHTLQVSLHPVLRRIPLVPEVRGPTRLIVRGYPGALMQVLTNLLMNSAMHAFEGVAKPEVVIDVQCHGACWTLNYGDNGVGVPEALHQKIFEPFFTTRRGKGGTGLGLNIVYTLVTQRLKGQLVFASTPGHGVHFDLAFPLHVPAEVDDAQEASA